MAKFIPITSDIILGCHPALSIFLCDCECFVAKIISNNVIYLNINVIRRVLAFLQGYLYVVILLKREFLFDVYFMTIT